MTGRRAVLVGASGGMGEAIAVALANEGATVTCLDPTTDGAKATAAAAQASAAAFACDVTDPAQVEVVFREITAEGDIDILVYNAAAFTPSVPAAELPVDAWNRAIAVNLTGAFLSFKASAPALRANGGSATFIASQLGRVGLAGSAAYCATKGGLIQFARAAALDYAADKIRVNTVSPGGTATERIGRRFGTLERAESEWGRGHHPLGRLARPNEIAAAVVYLASDDAAFITGTDLLVDGGYTAG